MTGMSTIPYQPKVFCAFIAIVGRLFYDDASVVLLDFFAKEQRAFSEAELKEVLKWRENLLLQQLAKLEQQLLLERVIESERGSRTVYFWRLHPQVCAAVDWRLKSLLEHLQNDVDNASQQNSLVCPSCKANVSLLDAACGPKALEDDHPLCKNCNVKLTTCNSEQARQQAEDRLARAHKSLDFLREFVSRVRGMDIPSFTSEKYEVPDPAAEERQKAEAAPVAKPAEEAAAAKPASRVLPWFNNQAAAAAPATTAAVPSNVAVSFGRTLSASSIGSSAVLAANGSAVSARSSAASMLLPGITSARTSVPLAATPLSLSTPVPPTSAASVPSGFGGINLALTNKGSTLSCSSSKSGKPFSLSLKGGSASANKSDLSSGTGRVKRPPAASSALSQAFDKRVRF